MVIIVTKKMLLRIGMLIFTSLSSTLIFSADLSPILLDSREDFALAKEMQMYIDTTRKLTINDVTTPNFSSKFIPYDYYQHTKYNNLTLWVRFKVYNPNPFDKEVFLTTGLPNPFKTWVLYTENANKQFATPSQFTKPWHIDIYPLVIKPHATNTYYLSFDTEGAILKGLKLVDVRYFTIKTIDQYFLLGMHYGVPLALLFYTIMILLFAQEASNKYLPYMYFLIVAIIAASLKDGLLNRIPDFFVPNWWYLHTFRFSLLCLGFLTALFAQRLLEPKKFAPRLNRVMNGFLILLIPLSILTYLSISPTFYGKMSVAIVLYQMTGTSLGLIAAIFAMKNKYKPAFFYFIGGIFILLGYSFYAAGDLGVIPVSNLSQQGPQFGLDLDVICQMMALAVHFNLIQRSEVKTQKNLINQFDKIEKLKNNAVMDQKKLIKSYARFFPKPFTSLLKVDSIKNINLGDEIDRFGAILVGDLRNFTTLIENKSPEESFNFINNYLQMISPMVRANHGFINKYIGDAILAIFKHPDRAVNAAIQIHKYLKHTHAHSLEMGIGIHAGPIKIGMIGEKKRIDGVVTGEPVLFATFLEKLNKLYHTHILITENVLMGIANKSAVNLRFIDCVKTPELGEIINIYEIFDTDEQNLFAKKKAIQQIYQRGISYYQHQEFKNAWESFKECESYLPDDYIIQLYLKRSYKLWHNPPASDWQPIASPIVNREIISSLITA